MIMNNHSPFRDEQRVHCYEKTLQFDQSLKCKTLKCLPEGCHWALSLTNCSGLNPRAINIKFFLSNEPREKTKQGHYAIDCTSRYTETPHIHFLFKTLGNICKEKSCQSTTRANQISDEVRKAGLSVVV